MQVLPIQTFPTVHVQMVLTSHLKLLRIAIEEIMVEGCRFVFGESARGTFVNGRHALGLAF